MAVSLRKLLAVAGEEEVNSELIQDFLARNPALDLESKQRLLAWKEELDYWRRYGEFMVSKYGRPYIEGALYDDLKKKVGYLIKPCEGELWLDAGCGELAMSELIWQKSGRKVKGIWAADIVLIGARRRLDQLKDRLPVELIYADLQEQLSFPDNYFDGIIGNHVFTFLIEFEGRRGKEALEGVLREMFRILKPGGHMVWSLPRENVSNLMGALISMKHILNPVHWLRYRVFLPVAAVKVFRYTHQIEEKGEQGTYLLLTKEECDEILASVGFMNPEWDIAFARQCWVNRVYKPDVT